MGRSSRESDAGTKPTRDCGKRAASGSSRQRDDQGRGGCCRRSRPPARKEEERCGTEARGASPSRAAAPGPRGARPGGRYGGAALPSNRLAALMRGLSTLMPERLRRPLRSPSFRRLALGKSISYLGDWLMVAVLVGWVYESTASIAQVATLMAIRLLPPIVGGGVAASLVDRLPRRRVLVWGELACAAAVAGALVGVVVGSRPIVFAFVGLCGLVGMVSTVAGNALIPMVVEAEELAAANAIHSVGQEAAMALGAVVGGMTLAAGGATAGLAANLASYAIAVLLFARIAVVDERAQPEAVRTRGGFASGVRYVLARSTLTVVVGSFALLTL